jgi:hypothetical protein
MHPGKMVGDLLFDQLPAHIFPFRAVRITPVTAGIIEMAFLHLSAKH